MHSTRSKLGTISLKSGIYGSKWGSIKRIYLCVTKFDMPTYIRPLHHSTKLQPSSLYISGDMTFGTPSHRLYAENSYFSPNFGCRYFRSGKGAAFEGFYPDLHSWGVWPWKYLDSWRKLISKYTWLKSQLDNWKYCIFSNLQLWRDFSGQYFIQGITLIIVVYHMPCCITKYDYGDLKLFLMA